MNVARYGQWRLQSSRLDRSSRPCGLRPTTSGFRRGTNVELQGGVYPYVKNLRVYSCPSDVNMGTKHLSYSMSEYLGYQGGTPTNLATVDTPAATIILIDEQLTLNDGNFNPCRDGPSRVHEGGVQLCLLRRTRQVAAPGDPDRAGLLDPTPISGRLPTRRRLFRPVARFPLSPAASWAGYVRSIILDLVRHLSVHWSKQDVLSRPAYVRNRLVGWPVPVKVSCCTSS